MALKIYNQGGKTILNDGTNIIMSEFAFYQDGNNITIVDLNGSNNIKDTWNVIFSDIQNSSGSQAGASLADTITYLGDNAGLSVTANPTINLGFQTSTLLTNGQTYDSGVLSLENRSQVQTSVLSDKNGTLTIDFIRDSGGTDILRTLTIPYVGGSGFEMFSSVAFTPFVRYRFTCNEVGQTDFYFDTKILSTSLSSQILDLTAFISPAMVATLGRNVIVGQDGNGTFSNCSVVETSNDSGTYHSLQVVNGARPSELTGRTHIDIVIDEASTSSLLHTVAANKTFYVTDILITVENSAAGSGVLKFEDGIIASQPVKTCFMIADPAGASSSLTTISHSFIEPIEFSTGVWLNESSGTLVVCGTISGYQE